MLKKDGKILPVTFVSTHRWTGREEPVGAAAVFCYDPRFALATDDFLTRGFSCGQIVRISGAGAAYDLCQEKLDGFGLAVIKDLRLTLRHHQKSPKKRILVLHHEDCARYSLEDHQASAINAFQFAAAKCQHGERNIREHLSEEISRGLLLECFWATLAGEFFRIQ